MLIHCRSKMEKWLTENVQTDNVRVNNENRAELQSILDTDTDNKIKLRDGDYIFCPKGEYAEIHSNASMGHRPGGTDVRARLI